MENHGFQQTNTLSLQSASSTYTTGTSVSDDEIRRRLELGPHQELSLWSLTDPLSSARPRQSTAFLIQLAILGSSNRQLTAEGICQALEERFDWFRLNQGNQAWRVSFYVSHLQLVSHPCVEYCSSYLDPIYLLQTHPETHHGLG